MSADLPDDGESSAVRLAFLKRYHQDLHDGGAKPLEVYQAAFRGYEVQIASEFARIQGRGDPDTNTLPGDPGRAMPDSADQVDGYDLLEVLGQGGMGRVYRARQTEPIVREVALKVVKLGMDTRDVVARFESERQTLALLEHPSIARVYDAGATRSGRPFFSMELVRGTPITRFCSDHGLRIHDRLRLFIDVCDAVQHAHQKGIIHRDLKPSNVLVESREGKAIPKVIDFGIAKSMHHGPADRSLVTEAGQVIGTPEYMSPEQADLAGIDVDTRADIYSLGVVLYELLTGSLPLEPAALRARSSGESARRIAETVPARPSTRLRTVPPDLDWIVMKAIETDRERRYASASELARDVQRHLDHEPVLAGPPGLAYRLKKLVRRRRTAISVTAATLVLAGLSGLSATRAARRSAEMAAAAASREHIRLGEAALERFDEKERSAADLGAGWRASFQEHGGTRPVWALEGEIEAWQRWQAAQTEAPQRFNEAAMAFQGAMEAAPAGSPEAQRARGLLAELLWRQFEKVFWQGAEETGPEYLAGTIQTLGDPAYLARLDLRARLELTSDPPGAEVRCFRHEMVEGRWFPLAFDPARGRDAPEKGVVGRPFLAVARVWKPAAAGVAAPPFEAGDRIATVGAERVETLTRLVRLLEALSVGQSTAVTVLRGGKEVAFQWTPFGEGAPRLADADDLRKTLGVTFEGYPLDIESTPVAGVTSATGPLRLDLPRGSYLLVLRKPGCLDSRLPVSAPLYPEAADGKLRVRLLEPDAVPQGFIHVPGGWFACGGDADSDFPLPVGRRRVHGFLISRAEVTLGDYAEFLNAAEASGRLDDRGTVEPKWEWPSMPTDEMRAFAASKTGRVQVIFPFRDEPIFRKDAGTARWEVARADPAVPLFEVSVLAALEYAQWLTEKHRGRWKFRLPTDVEWEKAARGTDRRFYVWGDCPILSYCRWGGVSLVPAGAFPCDESVYGVRELAGSVSEPTLSRKQGDFVSVRGGSWYATTDYFTRIANRNGHPADRAFHDQGIRLVAELPAE